MRRLEGRRKLKTAGFWGRDGGFSLVEVIVAMAILAIVSIPLLRYFTDSISRSASMAMRQKATLTAQEIAENLKARDQLIERYVAPDGNVSYKVEYLTDTLGLAVDNSASSFDASAGTGGLVLTGEMGDFDVVLGVSTDTPANDVERSMVYGIDDTKDVLIIERDQLEEAVVYFTSANMANPALAGLSRDEIISRLDRTICITVDYADSVYTVRAYYKYETADDTVTGTAGQTYESTFLTETRISSLDRIYLLYDGLSGLMTDKINFSLNGLVPGDDFDFYAVCQEFPGAGDYTIEMKGDYSSNIKVHFNARSTNDRVKNAAGHLITAAPLNDTGTPVRLVSIDVKVYKKEHEAGDIPLAEMKTTKGE